MALPILDQFAPDQVAMLHTMLQVITRKSPSKKDFKIWNMNGRRIWNVEPIGPKENKKDI